MKKQAFTLVELIVVITTLAILGTIGFINLQGFSSEARDANRISTVRNIQTGLEVFSLKSGKYPTPDSPISYTGGLDGKTEIKQGIVGEAISRFININNLPVDPKDKSNYVYSVFGEGEYYQVGTVRENIAYNPILNTTFADSKTAIVKGNYKFDPTLPSLIVVRDSVTGSGIFDPEVCFVVDGGKNTIDNCVEKKSEMSLKDFDSGLVGYWDFNEEGFTVENHEYGGNNFFKDYSGNGNHAFNSGAIQGDGFIAPSQVDGYIGKGLYFSSGSLILGSDLNFNFIDSFTLSTISNIYEFKKGPYPNLFRGRYFLVDYAGCNYFPTVGMCPVRIPQNTAVNSIGFGVISRNAVDGTITSFNDALYRKNNLITLGDYYKLDFTFEKDTLKVYINGIKNRTVKSEGFIFSQYLTGTIDQTAITIGGILATNPNEIRDFNGIIDEVKIYNRALNDEEILQQAKISGF